MSERPQEKTATLMDMARAERSDLAAFLATLTPEQWEEWSLCTRWRVREVVAHVISYEDLGPWGLLARFAKGRIVHANQVGVEDFAVLSPEQMVAYVQAHLVPRGLTSWFGGMIALVDGTIHHQDIRRTLDRPRQIPPERLRRVLDLVPPNGRCRRSRP